MLRFSDRFDAGRLLANHLGEYARRTDVVVVPVRLRAIPVATSLSAALRVRYDTSYATRDVLRSLAGCTTILVDDGFDSIERIREAIIVSRGCQASQVVAAAPLGTTEVSHAISRMADDAVCLSKPVPFRSVGFWYDDSVRRAAQAVVRRQAGSRCGGPQVNRGRASSGVDQHRRRRLQVLREPS